MISAMTGSSGVTMRFLALIIFHQHRVRLLLRQLSPATRV
jgi:hypothetical protein